MRILVNDFGGYPFPAQLSGELARRGHDVTHSWCGSLVDTPASARSIVETTHDERTPEFVPLDLGEPLDKYRYVKRYRQERAYGRLSAALIEDRRPDVVLAANVPLDAQRRMLRTSRRLGVPFVFWLQDLIGPATENLLAGRLPVTGRAVGRYYTRVEARLLRQSAAVVPITDAFRPYLERCGVDGHRITTVENWAPLPQLPVRPKDNPWSAEHGLVDQFVFAYTGALGMKQDPDLLLDLAEHFGGQAGVRIVVHSGGPELEHLRARASTRGLENLNLHGFAPWRQLPDVLGTADVALASIHHDAGRYSVPSKVLSYLCAGRPLLISVPAANLSATIVRRAQAGIAVEPGDTRAFLAAADRLFDEPDERVRMGANARRYAEAVFAIEPIADRFEEILVRAVTGAEP